MSKGVLRIRIVGDASHLKKTFGQTQGMFGSFSAVASKAFVGLAAGAAAAGAVVGMALKTGFDELKEAQRLTAQTNAVLKSTGGVANVSKKDVLGLVGALEKKSGVDGELIQNGANLLLTFTKVRNEVGKGNDIFNQATATALDMSVALGQDAKSSAIQLGKALNDPIKGVTALQRVGVSFTADQRKMIEALVKSGDVLGAQKLILAELNTEFAGSAEAFGNTMPGRIEKLKRTFEGLAVSLVEKLMPTLESLMTWADTALPAAFATAERAMDSVAAWWANNGPSILSTARTVFEGAADALGFLARNAETIVPLLAGVLGGVLAFKAITQVQAWVGSLVGVFNSVRGAVQNFQLQMHLAQGQGIGLGRALLSTVGANLASFAGLITGVVLGAFVLWRQAKETAKRKVEELTRAIELDSGALGENTRQIVVNRLEKDGLLQKARSLGIALEDVTAAALGDEAAQRRVAQAVAIARRELGEQVVTAGRVGPAHQAASEKIRQFEHGLGKLTGELGQAKSAHRRMQEAMQSLPSQADRSMQKIGELAQVNQGLASRMAAAGAGIGTAFGQGVGRGIDSMAPALRARANAMIDSTIIAAKRRAGIASPSKVAAQEIGVPIGQGVIVGIESQQMGLMGVMSESLAKLMKVPAVAQVVNAAKAIGVSVSDELATAISKGQVKVSDAMKALGMETARQAREIAEKIAEEVRAGVDSIMGAFSGSMGRFSAARSLRDARKEFEAAQARKQTIQQDITGATGEVARAKREAEKVTLAEERAIIQAQQRVREAEAKLAATREDAEATTDDRRLAEIDLAMAVEELTATQAASTAMTEEVTRAEERLKALREEEAALDQRLADAKDRVTEAQLAAIEAQRRFEESTRALVESGAKGEAEFRRLAEAIGLTTAEVDRLIRIAHSIPTAAGQAPPVLRNMSPAEQAKAAGIRARLANPNISAESRARQELRLRELEGRANGGPVNAGQAYWVGENKRPELFVPKQSGTIIPEHKVGGTTIVYHITNNIQMAPGSDGADLVRKLKEYERSNGTGWRA